MKKLPLASAVLAFVGLCAPAFAQTANSAQSLQELQQQLAADIAAIMQEEQLILQDLQAVIQAMAAQASPTTTNTAPQNISGLSYRGRFFSETNGVWSRWNGSAWVKVTSQKTLTRLNNVAARSCTGTGSADCIVNAGGGSAPAGGTSASGGSGATAATGATPTTGTRGTTTTTGGTTTASGGESGSSNNGSTTDTGTATGTTGGTATGSSGTASGTGTGGTTTGTTGTATTGTGAASNPTGGKAGNFALLPSEYLSTKGSQIVDSAGNPVRLSCVAFDTWMTAIPVQTQLDGMKANGFNCTRVLWDNAHLTAGLALIDQVVAAASANGLKVIIDHHSDEGDGQCAFQQANGLWYDSGAGTDGTDGCGATGTVTQQSFLSDWLTVAQHYAGNNTVIGFDLDNEPLEQFASWGGGGTNDLQKMYTDTGNAIQQVDPGALIIAEGPITWDPIYGEDLRGVKTLPVTLNMPNKVVYSVHLYTSEVTGAPFDSGTDYIKDMNVAWGYLVAQNIAPVWIGEFGASMNSADDTNWANTIIPYINGLDGGQGGPTFTAPNQPISTDWWCWCEQEGQQPDGLLDNSGNVRPEQTAITDQLHYTPSGGSIGSNPVTTIGSGTTGATGTGGGVSTGAGTGTVASNGGTTIGSAVGAPSAPLSSTPLPAAVANIVQVDFTKVTGQVVNPEIFGLSTSMGDGNHDYLTYADPGFWAVANKYPTPLLRHNWELNTFMDILYPSRDSANSPNFTALDTYLNNTNNFSGFVGPTARTLVTLGFPSWLDITSDSDRTLYAQMVVAIAQHFNAKGTPLKWVELVNEPDGHYTDANALAQIFNVMADALHAYDSTIQCGGLTDSWYQSDRMATFYSVSKDRIGFISWHFYSSCTQGGQSDQDTVNNGLNGIPSNAQAARQQATAAGISPQVPLFLGEWNMDGCDYNNPNNGNMVGATNAGAVTTGIINANVNMTMAALWETANDGTYAVFGNTPDYNNGMIDPPGLTLSWLSQFMPGNLVPTVMPSNAPGLMGYGTRTGNGPALALINSNLSSGVTVDLSRAGFGANITRHEISNASPGGAVTSIASGSLGSVAIPAGGVVIITSSYP